MVERPCEICGKVVPMRAINQKYCTDCADELRMQRQREYVKRWAAKQDREPMSATLVCTICGKTTERKAARQKYCPECAAKEKARRQHERAMALKKPTPTRREACEMCGKIIEMTFPNQKYCPECAASITYTRRKKLNREERELEVMLQNRRKKQEESKRNMVHIVDAARAAGMTYGQYTAMMRMKEN